MEKGVKFTGALANTLQLGEIIVQRLSTEVVGKAQKYNRVGAREFVAFNFNEVTLENIKEARQLHYCDAHGENMECDVLAGEQGPSCRLLSQIPDLKLVYVRFIVKKEDNTSAKVFNKESEDSEDFFPAFRPKRKKSLEKRAHSLSESEPTTCSASKTGRLREFPKSLSVTEMLNLGKLKQKSGTVVHVYSFSLTRKGGIV